MLSVSYTRSGRLELAGRFIGYTGLPPACWQGSVCLVLVLSGSVQELLLRAGLKLRHKEIPGVVFGMSALAAAATSSR